MREKHLASSVTPSPSLWIQSEQQAEPRRWALTGSSPTLRAISGEGGLTRFYSFQMDSFHFDIKLDFIVFLNIFFSRIFCHWVIPSWYFTLRLFCFFIVNLVSLCCFMWCFFFFYIWSKSSPCSPCSPEPNTVCIWLSSQHSSTFNLCCLCS